MRPTNEPAGGPDARTPAGLPDRDNPFAWKRASQVGKQGAHALLAELTDEEVARYMSIAEDQVRLEARHVWPKVGSAVLGAVVVGLALWTGFAWGFSLITISGLGLGMAMGYWPWRVLKCRQLWQKHVAAAHAEQVRRASLAL
jgi:hypothetical protein